LSVKRSEGIEPAIDSGKLLPALWTFRISCWGRRKVVEDSNFLFTIKGFIALRPLLAADASIQGQLMEVVECYGSFVRYR
jgi:hypothetical protein